MCPGLSAYPLSILSMWPRAVLSSEGYGDFLSDRFSWPTKAAFACLVQSSVRFAHLAVRNTASAGNVRPHPERLLCESLPSGKLIGKLHLLPQRSDAAGTCLARPRTATYAEGANNAPSVLSKKDRAALRLWDFTSCCRRGAGATASIVLSAKR